MTGTSFQKGEDGGKIVFFDRSTFERVHEISVPKAHVVRTLWHPKLNQIIVGASDGTVRLYYDADKSHNGAKLCLGRPKKIKQVIIFNRIFFVHDFRSFPFLERRRVYCAYHHTTRASNVPRRQT